VLNPDKIYRNETLEICVCRIHRIPIVPRQK